VQVSSRPYRTMCIWSYSAVNGSEELLRHFRLTLSSFSHDVAEPVDLDCIRDGTWHHVAVTWALHKHTLVYIDGHEFAMVGLHSAHIPLASEGLMVIGHGANRYTHRSTVFAESAGLLGLIDNFRVWDGVLSPTQVHDVVYMPKGRVSEYVADFNLLVWLTFDDDQTRSTLLDDNSTRVESVYDAESNVTAFGGCFGCSDLMLLASAPLLAVSDCPVITSSVLPARYSPHWPSTQDVTIPVLLRSEGECSRVSDSDGLDVWNGLEVSSSWNASTVIVGNVTLIRVLNESRNMMCEVLGGAVVTLSLFAALQGSVTMVRSSDCSDLILPSKASPITVLKQADDVYFHVNNVAPSLVEPMVTVASPDFGEWEEPFVAGSTGICFDFTCCFPHRFSRLCSVNTSRIWLAATGRRHSH
jgi:hypothetical protein